MPYNPDWPQYGDDLTSIQLRAQWNGLKAFLDAHGGQLNALTVLLEGLQSLVNAQAGQIAAQATQLDAQAAQITDLQTQLAALPPGVPQAQYDQDLSMTRNILDYCTHNLPNYRSQQVGPLTITLSDPPTLADAQAIVDKLNAYITALSTAA